MPKLVVHFVGPVRRPRKERTMEMDCNGMETVEQLLERLGYQAEEQKALHILVDGQRTTLSGSLSGAQRVEILVALGGG